jgi:hypothetical protein
VRTMDGQSTLDLHLLEPADRRRWLLTKALETASLAEALSLAQSAEDFLSGRASGTMDRLPEIMPAVVSNPKIGVPAKTPVQTPITPEVRNPEALEGLSSLASIDDVVRYLQQCGEGTVLETDNAAELLARANCKRASQGLPAFALLRVDPAPATRAQKPDQPKKVAPPRPPNARERAEWARRVAALPAA